MSVKTVYILIYQIKHFSCVLTGVFHRGRWEVRVTFLLITATDHDDAHYES